LNFSIKNTPARLDDILRFEMQRGIILPDSYRKFLVDCNGGRTAADTCYAIIPGWNELLVNEMLGLTEQAETSLYRRQFSNFSTGTDAKFLVFGYDVADQRLILDLRDGSYGKVYIRNHVHARRGPLLIDDAGFAPEDYEEAALFIPLADNFESFIAMLGPEPQ
jgi:hypothetical protein